MALGRLEEVSYGTYDIARPLTIKSSACFSGVYYPSCYTYQCKVTERPDGIGFMCKKHNWQRTPTFRFATRLLLIDWKGDHLWITAFDECMRKLLPFDVNTYASMTTDDARFEAMSQHVHGVYVKVTIKKQTRGDYVNYIATKLEVMTV